VEIVKHVTDDLLKRYAMKTLATVAETAYSMGHREHAERTLAEAEKGYADMFRYFSQAKQMTPEVEKELKALFKQLRERLDGLPPSP
jgi:hypothetical protein